LSNLGQTTWNIRWMLESWRGMLTL